MAILRLVRIHLTAPYIDVLSHAPVWSIYMEMVGIFLAFPAGLLYLLHHNKEKRGDDDHFDA
jgi:hypothetical protein